MAKAAPIEGLSGSQPFGVAAGRVLRVRAAELAAHLDGVLDVDHPRAVYDARVASRRLRAVLEIFAPCFEAKEHRRVLRQVKRLADALGERRDPDVQIAALGSLELAVARADRPGVQALIETFRAEQEQGNAALAEALHEAEAFALHERLTQLAESGERRGDNTARGVPGRSAVPEDLLVLIPYWHAP